MTMEIEISDDLFDMLEDMKTEEKETFDDIIWRLIKDDNGRLPKSKNNYEEVKGFLLKLPASQRAKLTKLAYASGKNVSDYIRAKLFSQQTDEALAQGLDAESRETVMGSGLTPSQVHSQHSEQEARKTGSEIPSKDSADKIPSNIKDELNKLKTFRRVLKKPEAI